MKKLVLALALLLLPALSLADDLDKYIELMRSDMRTKKTEVLTEALELTEAEAQKFWPIQREYETELAKLQDQRLVLIKDYAAAYETMNDKTAKDLVNRAFKLTDQRTDLLKKYTGKITKDVSARTGARFAQVESFIQAIQDVAIRGEIPLYP